MTDTPENPVTKYLTMISVYDNEFMKWENRTTKIIRRYRDENRADNDNETAKFNILWSNVQTLTPAVFARMPKADVSRRFGDNDQIGRVASLLIERALDFEVEHYPDFRATMKSCVLDRFLGGRGTAWVRYEPHIVTQGGEFDDGAQITEDADEAPQDDTQEVDQPAEEIEYECAPTDYVHWKDFGHTVCRTWEEVPCVWRWVYMDKDALEKRFKEKAAGVPMDNAPDDLGDKNSPSEDKTQAKICELWDKDAGKAFWFYKGASDFLDVKDDPLELGGFFPCSPPLYATMTSDKLVPVPDFVLYQDQARDLDILCDRIDGLVKALRVRGVYDSSIPELQRLMTEGDNLTLIPVVKWGELVEKGGLLKSVDLLPIEMIAKALLTAYQAFRELIAQIHEITGISDIIRGQSVASETATAQQIKGQYAGLRLRAMQQDVALFATHLLRLKAQVICTKFQPETIIAYAAAGQLSDADKALVPKALQLLQSDPLRNFRIEVAADSLVQLDEAQEKTDRLEFMGAFGGFMEKALPAAQAEPKLLPLLIDRLKYGIGAFKGARTIEGSLDGYLSKLKETQAAAEGKPKPPTLAELDMQREQAMEQQKAQAEQQRAAAELQFKRETAAADMEFQREKFAAEIFLRRQEMAMEHERAMAEMNMKLQHEAAITEKQREHERSMPQLEKVVA